VTEAGKSGHIPAVIWGNFAVARTGDPSDKPIRAIAVFASLDEIDAGRKAVEEIERLRLDPHQAGAYAASVLMGVAQILVDYRSQLKTLVFRFRGSPTSMESAAKAAAASAISSTLSEKAQALSALAELGPRAVCVVEEVKKLCDSPSTELAETAKMTLSAISGG